MKTTIFLDIDNTLLDFDICAKEAMKECYKEFHLVFHDDMFIVFTRINNGLWHDIERGVLTREELWKIRWNIVFKELGIDGVDGVAFEDSFHSKLAVEADLVEGAYEITKYLSEKYILCATSNGPYNQQKFRLEKAGLLKYFTHLFISERAGASKPKKEFFDYCMESIKGTKLEDIMLIGDSLTADIDGGVLYGIDTIWFNHDRQKEPENPKYKYKVDKLIDIENIL